MQEIANNKIFAGEQRRYQHRSQVLDCDMVFSVYLPPRVSDGPVPVLYWLSGLTCDDQNFVTKAGAQRYAAEYGVAIVAPDTSPRGEQVADVPEWDFAQGAGFYLNATQQPWSGHYRMYDYIVEELPGLLSKQLPLDHSRCGVFGHSMGGHGALTIALKNPGQYQSVSAFAPICAPADCPWGRNAFSRYLGDDERAWQDYDASALVSFRGTRLPILVDQGDKDEFLDGQLLPYRLQQACEQAGVDLELRMQPGYDHSYYFIATFIGEHIAHHAAALG